MQTFRVTISNPDNQAMVELVTVYKIAVLDHSVRGDKDKGYQVDAFLTTSSIEHLKSLGYKTEQHEDISEYAKAARAQVGKGNRYTDKNQTK